MKQAGPIMDMRKVKQIHRAIKIEVPWGSVRQAATPSDRKKGKK